jgi:hypothetical protein
LEPEKQQEPSVALDAPSSEASAISEEYQTMLRSMREFFDVARGLLRECAKGICDCLVETNDKNDAASNGKMVAEYANVAKKLASISASATAESMRMVETFNVAGNIPYLPDGGSVDWHADPVVVEITSEFDYDEALKGVERIRGNVKELLSMLRVVHNFISTIEHPLNNGKRVDPNAIFFLVTELCKIQVLFVPLPFAFCLAYSILFFCCVSSY